MDRAVGGISRSARVDLRGQPLEAQPVAIHAVSLQYPLGARLIKERPEHCYKQVNDTQATNDLEAFFTEGFAQESHAASGDVDKHPPAHPKDNRSQ